MPMFVVGFENVPHMEFGEMAIVRDHREAESQVFGVVGARYDFGKQFAFDKDIDLFGRSCVLTVESIQDCLHEVIQMETLVRRCSVAAKRGVSHCRCYCCRAWFGMCGIQASLSECWVLWLQLHCVKCWLLLAGVGPVFA
ncbi:unnamed protein product [Arabidopsis thaliana]|uniref:Uncharacterized protein n=1 Tax=Arabidopsis thaliana TaxID=3702 RepID=A0A654G4R6_ARATH|nr:unnamed protein product [Arabidopsis thaliana]